MVGFLRSHLLMNKFAIYKNNFLFDLLKYNMQYKYKILLENCMTYSFINISATAKLQLLLGFNLLLYKIPRNNLAINDAFYYRWYIAISSIITHKLVISYNFRKFISCILIIKQKFKKLVILRWPKILLSRISISGIIVVERT